ncbi:MAG: serine/threonine-protein kinase [Acidobacteriota bacterium]
MEEAQLAQLMEEFVSRIRRVESPDPEDYASRYPQLAERIRELFPTLTMLENAAGRKNTSQVRQEGLSAGMVIGAYYIRKEIGRGGMGIVYEAVRITDQKRVALKVLPLHSHLETKSLERFFREARITADLKHPNIVPIFDIGQAGDTAYFAMQYIEGSGLDRYLRRLHKQPTLTGIENRDSSAESENRDSPPLPLMDHLEWVARVGIQAASGLAYAHSRNLIHRDIKPSNLLLDSDGRLWIADFGLARNLEDTTITATGVLLGTPRYMSPEQAEAGTNRLDQRTDIYSLGVTLYELATRRPVFDGETQREILFQIFTRNPLTPRRLNRSIPKDLDRIIMRAIAKRPDNRYQSQQVCTRSSPQFSRQIHILRERWCHTSCVDTLWRLVLPAENSEATSEE